MPLFRHESHRCHHLSEPGVLDLGIRAIKRKNDQTLMFNNIYSQTDRGYNIHINIDVCTIYQTDKHKLHNNQSIDWIAVLAQKHTRFRIAAFKICSEFCGM